MTENENHSQQSSGLGSPACKLPRCGPDRMGSHQVRLGALTGPACRGCRTVKSCDSFGLGLALGFKLVTGNKPDRSPRILRCEQENSR
jgi:hypothetical protein